MSLFNSHSPAHIGINPVNFNYVLEKGESFQTPETVMVYSGNGFGDMSRTYHRLYRKRLCRGKYRDCERFTIINNWEATYFNFNEEKIVEIAKKASELGIDTMVLDDGWFGKRNDDSSSLGDWKVNRDKLPNGLGGLVKRINGLGMRFGLWLEPEMVSPDSELYRAHPDWVLHCGERNRYLTRNQLTLDLSRDDVCKFIIDSVSEILNSANIEYVKWDMNRYMSGVGSAALPRERQGEVTHRYILGLYRIFEALTNKFPNVLFESCASGGGRFDPGMLYYTPQIWVSDNTDAADRLKIQYGTSLVYPYSSMGAHVSAYKNNTNSFLKSASKSGVNSFNVEGFGSSLTSDFKNGRRSNREESLTTIEKLLKDNSQKTDFSFSGANAYVLPYAKFVTDLPIEASGYAGESYSVPFVQLVLNGIVQYSVEALNTAENPKNILLGCLASGSIPKYTVAKENYDKIKRSSYTEYYSVEYDKWFSECVEAYKYLENATEAVNGAVVVKHTTLADGVTCSEYSNGVKIYVNRSTKEYLYENTAIKEQDYTVVTGK